MKSSTLSLIIMTLAFFTTAHSQGELDRSKRPPALKTPTVQLPKIQKATLSNGLSVWLVEDHELPLVALNLVIQTGSDHDPLDKPGVASMTAEVLDEGTTQRDALTIADELEFIGATLGSRSGIDGSFVTLNTITRRLGEALDVFMDVLSNPTFPQQEVERLRKQRITSLLQQKDRPAAIASLAFSYVLYGSQHPYGADPSGTEKSLNEMTRADLVRFYENYYRPNNATLVVVGDVTLKDIAKRLEKGFVGWKSAAVPMAQLPSTPSVDKRRVYLIDKPGAAQSEIRIGAPAAARSTQDFFPITVMNRILGGQFSSRLNMNLREKHGFSYGVRSAFSLNKQPGPFVASGGVTTAKTDSSLQEFIAEIDRMHKEGITAEELAFAKKGMTGSFALGFETPAQIAGAFQNVVLYNLPENYYDTYLSNIDKVSLDEVRQSAQRYLDPSRMAVVVVGDLKVVKSGVEQLQLGETVQCDVEGKKLTQ